MFGAHVQNLCHVVVVERITAVSSAAAAFDHPRILQNPHLVGDGRLAHPDGSTDLADRQLAVAEGTDDPDSGGIRENGEDAGEGLKQAENPGTPAGWGGVSV